MDNFSFKSEQRGCTKSDFEPVFYMHEYCKWYKTILLRTKINIHITLQVYNLLLYIQTYTMFISIGNVDGFRITIQIIIIIIIESN